MILSGIIFFGNCLTNFISFLTENLELDDKMSFNISEILKIKFLLSIALLTYYKIKIKFLEFYEKQRILL